MDISIASEFDMKIPINFPSDQQVIAEEAARFRALSANDRINTIRGIVAAGAFMIAQSPKADFLRRHALEQEEQARQAIKEFVARHGC